MDGPAALELWLADHSLPSAAQVARCAGIRKSTIYRRWGSLPGLMFEAVQAQVSHSITLPDTGDLRADLLGYVEASVAFHRSELGQLLGRMVVKLTPEAQRRSWSGRFETVAQLFARVRLRGELRQDLNGPLIIELLIAPL